MTPTEYSHPTFDLDGDGQRVALHAPDVIEFNPDRVNALLARFGIPLLASTSDGTVYLDSARTLRYRQVPQPRQWGTMVRQVEIWERVD